MSIGFGGDRGDNSSWEPSISRDGRYVAFRSSAHNLVDDLVISDTYHHIFRRDVDAETTELVTVSGDGGSSGNDYSEAPSISPDGRYVAFVSSATNLVEGFNTITDPQQIFLRDTETGTTVPISVSYDGVSGDWYSSDPSASEDGKYVAFSSRATNLIDYHVTSDRQIFLRDTEDEITELISSNTEGFYGDGDSFHPSISADGRYVTFTSSATNLVDGGGGVARQVFVYDRVEGLMVIASAEDGETTQGDRDSNAPSISPEGRYVAFTSNAENLTDSDTTNWSRFVYLRDLVDRKTTLMSRTDNIHNTMAYGADAPTVSDLGKYVAFHSNEHDLPVWQSEIFRAMYDTNGDGIPDSAEDSNDDPIQQCLRPGVLFRGQYSADLQHVLRGGHSSTEPRAR